MREPLRSMATATRAARRAGVAGWLGTQRAEAAQHDAADRFAGFRVLLERRSVHALFDFEVTRFFAGLRRSGFIDVGGHTNSLSVEICGLKKLAQLLRPNRFFGDPRHDGGSLGEFAADFP